jgi:hypothetical protein
MQSECTLQGYCFDITAAAALYSALAGILAGFAFAAMVLIIDRHKSERRDLELEGVVVTLLGAFLGLVVSTFLYAVVSGEELTAPRAAILNLLASSAFSISILTLLLGLQRLLLVWNMPRAAATATRLFGTFAPTLIFIYLAIALVDIPQISQPTRHEGALDVVVYWPSIGLLIVLAMASFGLSRRRAQIGRTTIRFRNSLGHPREVYAVLTIVGITALVFGAVAMQEPTFVTPTWLLFSALAIIWTILMAFVIVILVPESTAVPAREADD